jgi:hypothetical protein
MYIKTLHKLSIKTREEQRALEFYICKFNLKTRTRECCTATMSCLEAAKNILLNKCKSVPLIRILLRRLLMSLAAFFSIS